MPNDSVPVLIDGRWLHPDCEAHTPVHNPSRGEVIARTPHCGVPEVDAAVDAARRAFPSWSQTPPTKRAQVLFRYKTLLETNFDALSRGVTCENGKTLEEARGDVRRGIEVVDFACGIAHLQKGESLPQVADGVDGLTMREPLGVCAGIAPFNFPAMVPMWMFPIAIACGNTFVLKPSEKVPLTAVRLAELFQEAGLPDGVLNLVHGGREVVESLCAHPEVAAVSFIGSSGAAKRVYALGTSHGKRVQAGGGAKNGLLVMPDADPDIAIDAIMSSAFGCAGQRCMAGSLLMGVGEAAEPTRNRLLAAMDALRVTDTSADDTAGMGPVIDSASRNRLQTRIDSATAEGLSLARDGRSGIPKQGFFLGPTLIDHVTPEHSLFREELFGPVLSLLRPETLEQAIEWVNTIAFGNGATIFTSSGRSAREFTRGVRCGMIGVNIGVPAAPALFPFSGWGDSFYGDLHVQGTEGVAFYTRQKVVLSRW